MFFQFHWILGMAQYVTGMRQSVTPAPSTTSPDHDDALTERDKREIAWLEAMFAAPALNPPHEPYQPRLTEWLGGMFTIGPGRFFAALCVIFAAGILAGF